VRLKVEVQVGRTGTRSWQFIRLKSPSGENKFSDCSNKAEFQMKKPEKSTLQDILQLQ